MGNASQETADELVEILWYFPPRKEKSDLFTELLVTLNLHGYTRSHLVQVYFLTRVSSAVLILIENPGETEYGLLSHLSGSTTKYYFIVSVQGGTAKKTQEFLQEFVSALSLTKAHLLVDTGSMNEAKFVKNLESSVAGTHNTSPRHH